jgi:hypothetical protein
MTRTMVAVVATLLAPALASAQTTEIASADNLAKALKPILIASIPPVLHDKTQDWNHTVMVSVIKFKGIKPYTTRVARNDGTWKKMNVTAQNLPGTLDLRIYNIKSADDGKQTFKIFLTFQMGVYYDQQNWESGLRLWSGSVRARAQVKLDLDCENTIRADFSKGTLPDFVMQLRVAKAKVGYDRLVVEHINGIGGTGAKLIGEAVHDAVNQFRPSLERDLLAKASDAVVRTAGTREIRVAFGSLIKAK